MKKRYVSMLIAAAFVFSFASCKGKKAKEEEQEKAASEVGMITQGLLTEELKQETILLLKDLPDSDLPQRIANGEVEIGVGNISYMLPVSKSAELMTASQKARALGVYFADYNLLKVLKQPLTELEAVMAKLTSDLDITFALNILKEASPAESKEAFYTQEEKIITAMADNNKIDVAVEMLGGIAVENAYLYANPSLVVKGDVTYVETLSDNMLKRFDILGEVINDISAYYPDLKNMSETISPLKDKIGSVNAARKANADILAIRNNLLK